MQSNNALLQFLQETILRFSTKSPKFFKVWQIISGALVLITGLPELLHLMNIELPPLWSESLNKGIAWASRGVFLMSLLTTQSQAVAIDTQGNILKKTNEDKLPFTTAQEKKTVKKEVAINEMVVLGQASTDNL